MGDRVELDPKSDLGIFEIPLSRLLNLQFIVHHCYSLIVWTSQVKHDAE